MNKKIVTLVCVTVLSGFVAGVNADELTLAVLPQLNQQYLV